jgi:hypothetical protein
MLLTTAYQINNQEGVPTRRILQTQRNKTVVQVFQSICNDRWEPQTHSIEAVVDDEREIHRSWRKRMAKQYGPLFKLNQELSDRI